jgi:hypothetical protein
LATREQSQTGSALHTTSVLFTLALLSGFANPVSAQSLFERVPLQVHAFVSQGFILTLENDYLADSTTDGSFEMTEVGINFTAQLTETLRLGLQLFAHDLGPSGDYTAMVDWLYLDYRMRDWLGFRAGRLKIPYGLHNENQDIDAARVPVLLPQSVYPSQTRQILFAQTGAELYGFVQLGALGALDYRMFGGTIFIDADSLTPPGSTVEVDFNVPYVVGGRLIWETPALGLRVGGSMEFVRLDTTAIIPTIAPIEIENETLLWVLFVEHAIDNLVLTAEYSRWSTDQASNNPMLSPRLHSLSERAYTMLTYRVASWLQPGAYYSILIPDVHVREGVDSFQRDLAATLRFDVHAHWLIKLEGHYMVGAASLRNPLRLETADLSGAERHWAAFFIKTTALF